MYQVYNPFINAAAQHIQTVMGESGRAVTNSQALVASCDEIVAAAQAGNVQATLAAAQNARSLAAQLANSAQMLNQAVIQHFERASFIMGKIQSRVNEVATALQQVGMTTGLTAGPLATYVASWQAPWYYGSAGPGSRVPLM